jgi:hypothetical protein
MTRLARIVLVTSALVLPLGGCASIGDALDPTEWFAGDLFNTKKKLPGDRKPVFPEGVPGVAQGIPQELVKGNQPPPQESGFASTDVQSTGSTPQQPKQKQKTAAKTDEYQPAPREKAKPKPNPKPATAERQPPAQERQPTTARRAPEPQQQQQQQQQPPQQQSGGSAVQWPEPPPPRSGSGSQTGGIQWPDPPPMR